MAHRRLYIDIDGEKLSALRRDLFMTQAELALKIGISRDFLAHLECGTKRGVSVRTLRAMLKALDLKPKDVNVITQYERRDDYDPEIDGPDDRMTNYDKLMRDRAEIVSYDKDS